MWVFGQLRGDVGQLNVISWLSLITADRQEQTGLDLVTLKQHTWPGSLFRNKDLFGFGILATWISFQLTHEVRLCSNRTSFMIPAEVLPLPRSHSVTPTGLRKEPSCSSLPRGFILGSSCTVARRVSSGWNRVVWEVARSRKQMSAEERKFRMLKCSCESLQSSSFQLL